MFYQSLVTLIAYDIVHIGIIVINQGMAPKNPHIHSMEYLMQIQSKNQLEKICKRCYIIEREDGEFRYATDMHRNVKHCD